MEQNSDDVLFKVMRKKMFSGETGAPLHLWCNTPISEVAKMYMTALKELETQVSSNYVNYLI